MHLKVQTEQLPKRSRKSAPEANKQKTTCMVMLAAIFLVTACTAQLARVLPQADGSYTVIANASSSGSAERGALKRAQQVCSEQDKLITVNNLETQYQGAGKEIDAFSSMISSAVSAQKDINIRNTANDPNNYVTTVNFTCS